MSFKKSLFSALILAGLIFYILKVELPKQQSEAEKEIVFKGLKKSAIQSIEISKAAQKFKLLNSNANELTEDSTPKPDDAFADFNEDALGKWKVDGVQEGTTDKATVNSLLTDLVALKTENTIPVEEVDSDLKVYGLGDSGLSIEVAALGRDKTILTLGKLNDIVHQRYLQISGRSEVFLVPDSLFESANKSRDDFRNRLPVSFEDADVSKIVSENPKVPFELVSESGKWSLTKPKAVPASQVAVNGFLRQLKSLRIAEFIEAPEGLEKYGLAKPSMSATVEFNKDKAKEPVVISAGSVERPGATAEKNAPKPRDWYFRVSNRAEVFKLAIDPTAQIGVDPLTLRERTLMAFNTWEAQKLEVSVGTGNPMTFEKVADTWKQSGVEAAGPELDGEQIRAYLDRVSRLEAKDYPAAPENAFNEPAFKVSVTYDADGAGKKTKTLLVAKKGPFENELFAKIAESEVTFSVDGGTFDLLKLEPKDFYRAPTPTAVEPAATQAGAK